MKKSTKIVILINLLALLAVCMFCFAACEQETEKHEEPKTIQITAVPDPVVLSSNDRVDLTDYLSAVTYQYTGTGQVTVEIERVTKNSTEVAVADFSSADLCESGTYIVYFSVSDGKSTEEDSFAVTMPEKNIGNFDTGIRGWSGVTTENLSDYSFGWQTQDDKYTNGESFTQLFQTGDFYLDTHVGAAESEHMTAVSPTFTVFEDSFITFKLAGAMNGDVTYAALVDASSGEILERYTNYNFKSRNLELTFLRYFYPVDEYAGRTVRLEFVDQGETNFGYIACNDVWVNLSMEEAQEKLSEEKAEMLAWQPKGEPVNEAAMQLFFSDVKNAYANVELVGVLTSIQDVTLTAIGNSEALQAVDLTDKLSEVTVYKEDVYLSEKRITSVCKDEQVDTEGDFAAYDLSAGGEYTVFYELEFEGGIIVERSFRINALTQAPTTLRNGSFEQGGTGWFISGGLTGRVFSLSDTGYFEWRPWFRDGTFFAWSGDNEAATGYIYSEPFHILEDTCIAFQFGSTAKNPSNYVALVDAATDRELVRFINDAFDSAAEMTMFHYIYDVSAFAGKDVYFKVNDGTINVFGNFCADDFRVNLSKAEAEDYIAQARNMAKTAMDALRVTVEDPENENTAAARLAHIAYVEQYYEALAVRTAVPAGAPLTGKQEWNFEGDNAGWYGVTDGMLCSDKDFFSGEDWTQYTDGTVWTDCRKEGEKFLRTDDNQSCVIYSPVFTVAEGGHIAFLLGTTAPANNAYVAVCLADGGKEIMTFKNQAFIDPVSSMTMFDVFADLSAYAGQDVFVKIVDQQSGGFGFVLLDDLRVNLTADEAEQLLAACKKSAEEFEAAGTPNDQDRFDQYKNVLKDYYANLTILTAQ